ncbi:MAG: NAD(P)-dependent alcohol dehydrogenase [Pseudomonadales bacterium]
MKAAIWTKYGPPEVLRVRDIPEPVPKRGQILVRIAAANVFPGDCELRRFQIHPLWWLPLRLLSGITRPRWKILGQEFSGEVVAVADGASGFRVGDRILSPTGFGGAYAEYLCLRGEHAVPKPAAMSDIEASALSVGGLNALHFLRTARVAAGQKVVIYGAGGSIGTMAVQLAGVMGAEVTAVDAGYKLDALRALGAATVVDYQEEDFTGRGDVYDAIVDVVGQSPFQRCLRVLREGGCYVHGNASTRTMLRRLWASRQSGRNVRIALTGYRSDDLRYLTGLVESGRLRVVVDRCFPLADVVDAHRYVETGRKIGNVVLDIAGAGSGDVA